MLIVAAHRLTTFVLKSVSGALAAMGVSVTANHLDWASPYRVDFGAILWQLFVVNQLSLPQGGMLGLLVVGFRHFVTPFLAFCFDRLMDDLDPFLGLFDILPDRVLSERVDIDINKGWKGQFPAIEYQVGSLPSPGGR